MESLLFTLTLGSFLMVLPYLSEGLTVQLKMPSYMGMNSREMKVTCEFTATNQLTKMSLLHGDTVTVVSYQITGSKFEIVPNNKITLEVSSGTTVKGGSLIFAVSRISCSDFTSYRCKGDGDFTTVQTDNKTLQVSPVVDSILKTSRSDIIVNQMSTFECRGTISKEGPYSVKWYLRTITPSSQIRAEQAKVIRQNQCSRSVSSSLTYNVSETYGLTLIFWCRIESGRTVDRMGNFTIQEMTTIAAPYSPQPVKAGLAPGSIVGIVLGIIASVVLVVLLVWFLVVRPKRLKAAGPSKDEGPEPNAKDYQVQENVLYATIDPLKKEDSKGKVNPALDDKQDADNAPYNAPYTVYPHSKYEQPPGGHSNPAMDQDMTNHMGGSTV